MKIMTPDRQTILDAAAELRACADRLQAEHANPNDVWPEYAAHFKGEYDNLIELERKLRSISERLP